MSPTRPKRPQMTLHHSAALALRKHPRSAAKAAELFVQVLLDEHHVRLPRGCQHGLVLALFQSAMERSVGDISHAARQIAKDLTFLHLLGARRTTVDQAA